jgi:16S rRNA processing protein RimM
VPRGIRHKTLSSTAGEGRPSAPRLVGEGLGAGRLLAPSPQPSPPLGEREPARRVCVAIVTGAHGVKGAVRLKSFTADPADVARYGPLEDESGERHFALSLVGAGKGVLLARLAGIADRNQAEALRGLRLYLRRAALPPTADDEYYHADLIGLDARLTDGGVLGRVRAVHDFGAGDTLEIERAGGPPIMVPFTRAVVPVVDLEAGRLMIDPPPGLLEPVKQNPPPPVGAEARPRRADPAPASSPSPLPSPAMAEREKSGAP